MDVLIVRRWLHLSATIGSDNLSDLLLLLVQLELDEEL